MANFKYYDPESGTITKGSKIKRTAIRAVAKKSSTDGSSTGTSPHSGLVPSRYIYPHDNYKYTTPITRAANKRKNDKKPRTFNRDNSTYTPKSTKTKDFNVTKDDKPRKILPVGPTPKPQPSSDNKPRKILPVPSTPNPRPNIKPRPNSDTKPRKILPVDNKSTSGGGLGNSKGNRSVGMGAIAARSKPGDYTAYRKDRPGYTGNETIGRGQAGAKRYVQNKVATIYTAKRGDTFETIAKRTGIDVNKLKKVNPWLMKRAKERGGQPIYGNSKVYLPGKSNRSY